MDGAARLNDRQASKDPSSQAPSLGAYLMGMGAYVVRYFRNRRVRDFLAAAIEQRVENKIYGNVSASVVNQATPLRQRVPRQRWGDFDELMAAFERTMTDQAEAAVGNVRMELLSLQNRLVEAEVAWQDLHEVESPPEEQTNSQPGPDRVWKRIHHEHRLVEINRLLEGHRRRAITLSTIATLLGLTEALLTGLVLLPAFSGTGMDYLFIPFALLIAIAELCLAHQALQSSIINRYLAVAGLLTATLAMTCMRVADISWASGSAISDAYVVGLTLVLFVATVVVALAGAQAVRSGTEAWKQAGEAWCDALPEITELQAKLRIEQEIHANDRRARVENAAWLRQHERSIRSRLRKLEGEVQSLRAEAARKVRRAQNHALSAAQPFLNEYATATVDLMIGSPKHIAASGGHGRSNDEGYRDGYELGFGNRTADRWSIMPVGTPDQRNPRTD